MAKKIPYYIITIFFIGATFYYGYYPINPLVEVEFIKNICAMLHFIGYFILFTVQPIFVVFLFYTPFVYIGAIITEHIVKYIIKLIIKIQEKRDE